MKIEIRITDDEDQVFKQEIYGHEFSQDVLEQMANKHTEHENNTCSTGWHGHMAGAKAILDKFIKSTLKRRILTVEKFLQFNNDSTKKILIEVKKDGKPRCESFSPVQNLEWVPDKSGFIGYLSWSDENGDPYFPKLFRHQLLENLSEDGGRYTTTVYLIEE